MQRPPKSALERRLDGNKARTDKVARLECHFYAELLIPAASQAAKRGRLLILPCFYRLLNIIVKSQRG